MYQFTQMMRELGVSAKKTYRWRGLVLGLLAGWIPAWGLTHWRGWGVWALLGLWALCLPLGYFSGNLLKK